MARAIQPRLFHLPYQVDLLARALQLRRELPAALAARVPLLHPSHQSFLVVLQDLEDLPRPLDQGGRKDLEGPRRLWLPAVLEVPVSRLGLADQRRLADQQDLVIPRDRRDPGGRRRPFHPLVLEDQPDLADQPGPVRRQRLVDPEVPLARQAQAVGLNRLLGTTLTVKTEMLQYALNISHAG